MLVNKFYNACQYVECLFLVDESKWKNSSSSADPRTIPFWSNQRPWIVNYTKFWHAWCAGIVYFIKKIIY